MKLHELETMSYYIFLNEKMIDYSVDDVERSIPNLIDGLKPSQRKIIYTVLKKRIKGLMKVADLAGLVSSQTSYHHGETSLNDNYYWIGSKFYRI